MGLSVICRHKMGDVKYTRSYDEAMVLLKKGEKVLFNPDWRTLQGIEGKFVPVFWSRYISRIRLVPWVYFVTPLIRLWLTSRPTCIPTGNGGI